MGQYFTAVVQKGTAIIAMDPEIFQGYKLTEHSWWYNGYVNAVCELLYKTPMRVAWVGDYSNGLTPEGVYEAAHGEGANPLKIQLNKEFTLDRRVLVNHTRRIYLDGSEYFRRLDGKNDLGKGWVIHPLPLLTAFGNGQGGGDYFSDVNTSDVGSWGWDVISVEDEAPEGYTKEMYEFCE